MQIRRGSGDDGGAAPSFFPI